METRRAADLEVKLNLTLKELKKVQNTCNELIQERDESEVEIKLMSDRHADLKKQLQELNNRCEDLDSQRDHLQSIVSSYDECRDTHEMALERICSLERQLFEANEEIKTLQESNNSQNFIKTIDLYSEVMCSPISPPDEPSVIDLTATPSHTTPNCRVSIGSSTKKIKNYVKLNRYIRKTENRISFHKKFIKSLPLRRQKLDLLKEVEMYQSIVNEKEIAISDMWNKINSLLSSLESVTAKYNSAKKEIAEHSAAMDNLLELGKSNLECFNLLTNNLTTTACSCSSDNTKNILVTSPTDQADTFKIPEQCHLVPELNNANQTSLQCDQQFPSSQPLVISEVAPQKLYTNTMSNTPNVTQCKTVLFSDKLGQGLGSMLHSCLNQSVSNYCFPGITYKKLVDKMSICQYDCNTTLILAMGNSHNISKSDVIKCIKLLQNISSHGIGKVIICAFPFSKSFNKKQNEHVHNLNVLLYTLLFYEKDIVFFDTNKFTSNFILTEDNMYLPKNLN